MSTDINIWLTSSGGYWQAQWRDAHGRQRTKSLGNKEKVSERAARKEIRALAARMATQPGIRNVGAKAPTLDEWCTEYVGLRPDWSPATRAEYDTTIVYLKEHLGATRKLNTITALDAKRWRAWLTERVSESTVRKHIRNAKVIFNEAVELHLIAASPFAGQVGRSIDVDADWHYVDMDQLDKLMAACPDQGWRALLGLCRLAGLRLREAIRLRWDQVDFGDRTLTIQHKGRQTTKHKTRTVPIQPRLMVILLERFEAAQPGETVTGVGDHNLTRYMQAIVKRAELEPWAKLYHTLRKNCESDWLATYPVMDVCRWLGHDPTVASKHYHQTTSGVIDAVTGRQAEQEATELDQARAEISRMRRRVRRVLKLAREARQA